MATIEPQADQTMPTAPAPLLEVRGLNVAYGDVQVLWDIDL